MGACNLSNGEYGSRRLLVVLHYGMYGGPHNRYANLGAPLADAGIDVTVVLPDEEGDAFERCRRAGVPVVTIPLGRIRARPDPRLHFRLIGELRRDVRRLKSVIHETGADAVLLAGLANPHAAIAGDQLGLPVIWQIVDSRVPAPARQILMRSVRKRADCVMFWGERIKALHRGDALSTPTMLSSSPVDSERFRFSADARREERAAWGVAEDAPIVGSIANLNPQKGIEYLIRAARLILERVPRTHFIVVGSRYTTHADYPRRLESELQNADIPPDRFRFVGPRSDTERPLAAFDVKVISSVPASEGIPTTALEAMSVGVPVVTTNVGSAAEAVIDGQTGFVVPPLSPSSISERVVDLLTNPALRERFGTNGRERAIEHFGISRAVDDHLEAFALARDHRQRRTR